MDERLDRLLNYLSNTIVDGLIFIHEKNLDEEYKQWLANCKKVNNE